MATKNENGTNSTGTLPAETTELARSTITRLNHMVREQADRGMGRGRDPRGQEEHNR